MSGGVPGLGAAGGDRRTPKRATKERAKRVHEVAAKEAEISEAFYLSIKNCVSDNTHTI